jgi:leucyl aminopeptidase
VLPSAINFLPVDLHRWDSGPGGDALIVPIWKDVRPLRGAAGMLDWRLNGKLSTWLKTGRLDGSAGEKMLFLTDRVVWGRVLTLGLGEAANFAESELRASLATAFEALRGIGARAAAIALPGRDAVRISPDQALRILLSEVERHDNQHGTSHLESLTVIDVPAAIKAMSETVREIQRALTSDSSVCFTL